MDRKWTSEDCDRRHKWVNRMTVLVMGILGLQMTFIGWSIQAANSAAEKADMAGTAAIETKVRVDANWQSSIQQLAGLRDALKELQVSQVKSDDRIIDELKSNRALVERMMAERRSREGK